MLLKFLYHSLAIIFSFCQDGDILEKEKKQLSFKTTDTYAWKTLLTYDRNVLM